MRNRKLCAKNPLKQHNDLLYWGHYHAGTPLPRAAHHFHQLFFSNVDRFQCSLPDQGHSGDRMKRRPPEGSCLYSMGNGADCLP